MLALILLGMVIGYLAIVLFLIYFVSKHIKKPAWRWTFRVALFALLLFLPLSDQIIGRYYFDHLCETEGGLHVYETIELGPEYYHEDGSPKFIDEKGKFDSSVFDGRYEFKRKSIENSVKTIVISKYVDSITDTSSGKMLGKYTRLVYRGGWLARNLDHVGGGTGPSCNLYGVGGGKYEDFLKYVFLKQHGEGGS